MSDSVSRFLRLDSNGLFGLFAVLAIIPIWLPPFPPLIDLPQHAAQIASLHALLNGDNAMAAVFRIDWFTPYLGGMLLLYLASCALPLIMAAKLVVSLAVIALPVVTGMLLRAVGGDERLKWLAIPAGYSFAFYWGFLSFLVAVPLSLLLLWLTVPYERSLSFHRALGIAAFSLLLFFFHIIALGFGALIALAWIVARNYRQPARLLRCAAPFTAPLPLMAFWVFNLFQNNATVGEAPLSYGPLHLKLAVLFNQLAGLDGMFFGVNLLVAATLALLPLLAGYRISSKPERWLPLLVGLIVYFSFPGEAANTSFIYHRVAVYLVPLWLLLWDRPAQLRPVWLLLIIGAIGIWIGVNAGRFSAFARDSMAFSSVLAKASPGKTMASLPLCKWTPHFAYPVYFHFASWYQAVRGGIADRSFAGSYPNLVRYRDPNARRVGQYISLRPIDFDWTQDGGARYDYFLVCATTDVTAPLFKRHANDVELIARNGAWWLYQRRNGSAQ